MMENANVINICEALWVHNIFKNDKGKEFFVCRVFFSKNSLKQEEIRAL